MGQKVNPIVFRLKIIHSWFSYWYCKKKYTKKLYEDIQIRNFISNKLHNAQIGKIYIERVANKIIINIYSSKPGIVIGKNGVDINNIKRVICSITSNIPIINITEIKKPEIDSFLISKSIAEQLEKRVAFRKIVKRAIFNAMKTGTKGIKILISGRLGGAEIARTEWYKEGKIPLQTLRANIDYTQINAKTIYGLIGIKVWIYKDKNR